MQTRPGYVPYTSRVFKFSVEALIRQRRAEKTASPAPGSQESIGEYPQPKLSEPAVSIEQIELALIEPNPERLRRSFDEDSLCELAESVKSAGILAPIILKRNGGRYIILAGERRYRAATIASRKTIPAIIKDTDNFEFISLIENVQRKDLTPIEECMAIKKLLDRGLRQKEVADILGKHKSYVSRANTISAFAHRYGDIDKLSTVTKSNGHQLGMEHLLHIAYQPTHKEGVAMLNEIIDNSVSVKSVRARRKSEQDSAPILGLLAQIRKSLDMEFLEKILLEDDRGKYVDDLRLLISALRSAQLKVEEVLMRLDSDSMAGV